MMYMPDAVTALIDLMAADPARLVHRNAFNVTAMNFTPEELAAEIRRHIPGFVIDYDVDPVRQAIADSWPNSMDDSAARAEWGWQPTYDLPAMVADMIAKLARQAEDRLRGERPVPTDRLHEALRREIAAIDERGSAERRETVITGVVPPAAGRGPRYLLTGEGDQPFLKMNSNNYLGMALREELRAAEERAVAAYGVGPGAVRFISGTYAPHVALEERLAAFHGREAAMLFSAAYMTIMGVLTPLVGGETAVISDELNHNCIINAMRLLAAEGQAGLPSPRPRRARRQARRRRPPPERGAPWWSPTGSSACAATTPPLPEIARVCRRHDAAFPENVVLVVDDSHGVGAFGATGRGTEEHTGAEPVDVLVATLGKALGVNGGYVVGGRDLVDYLRETAPMYIYSNPITPGEAAAALAAVDLLDSPRGLALLAHLREMTARFERGIVALGYETIPGPHPVVPLMVRDTPRTLALVRHLRAHGVLATGLNYPVVPRGDEEIRFQVSADHTAADIDQVLAALESFRGAA